MSVAGSSSSRGTSRSRSRSPPYSDGRYPPPRYSSSRYESYSYRSRAAMPNSMEDYRDLRERDRDRDRERDRPPLPLREDRYLPRNRERDPRYPRYYRDDMPPPHHYSSSSSLMPSREYPKPPPPPLRREVSAERIKDSKGSMPAKDIKDDLRIPSAGSDSYTPSSRYPEWRDRDRDRDRDRRYRDDDHRWRDIDMRNRERDSYMMRYESPAYGAPPPIPPPPSSSTQYGHPFGGDSYRPDRDRDRDLQSSTGGPPPHMYYERDRMMDDRDFYRHVPRNSLAADSDRYRGRPGRPWGSSSNSNNNPNTAGVSSTSGTSGGPGYTGPMKPRDRERDRDTPMNSPRTAAPASNIPPWAQPRLREDVRSENRYEPSEQDSRNNKPPPPPSSPPPPQQTSAISQPVESTTEPVEERASETTTTTTAAATGSEQENAPTTAEASAVTELEPNKGSSEVKKDTETTDITVAEKMVVDEPAQSITAKVDVEKEAVSAEVMAEKEDQDKLVRNEPTKDSAAQDGLAKDDMAKDNAGKEDHPMSMSDDNLQDKMEIVAEETQVEKTSEVHEDHHMPEADVEEGVISSPALTQEPPSVEREMTQQEIVERIGQIEDDIAMFEEMLEKVQKDEESKGDTTQPVPASANELPASAAEENKEKEEQEAAKQQALQIISEGSQSQPITDVESLDLKASPIMRKKPQLLINQARASDELDDLLSEKLVKENRKLAKENSVMIGGWQGHPDNPEEWSDEEKWTKPLYPSIEDYPCYKNNTKRFEEIKTSMAASLAQQKKDLEKKQIRLKREFKQIYKLWEQKNLALDRIREQRRRMPEKSVQYRSGSRRRTEDEEGEYVDGVVFTGDGDALRFGAVDPNTTNGVSKGPWTSDAARSEAELLEIIQSLESAEMRNPKLRAAKTTATIPPMILDTKERMRTFDDRRSLVLDPLTYYHTGPDTGDIWTQQEMAAFMEGYMQYPKQFDKISAAVKTKSAPQCVLFYYRKKKKIDFKALIKKGRRGKAKRRDRLAEAIRRVTGDTSSPTRKTKTKGSALMTDIGEAQVSRKVKQKETERKTKELREFEEANAYWDSVNDKRRTRRPGTPASQASTDDLDKLREKRRLPRRKGRSPRVSTSLPGDKDDTYTEAEAEEVVEKTPAATAKWTEKDKEAAIDGFKRHGRDFVRVAALVGTKTEDQCRNFYHNYKRKFGPNAFNEETEATRQDFNAEEEDAAAALVGLGQMGGNTNHAPTHTRSVSMQVDTQQQQQQQQQTPPRGLVSATATRRRRARSASGKVVDSEMMESWMDAEFSGRGGRRQGSGSASETTRRPTYSSYWSVSERSDFVRYLEKYGRDWEKVAGALASKTATQVRNFYMNNNEKMHLDEIARRHQITKQQDQGAAGVPAVSGIKSNKDKTPFANLPSVSFPSIDQERRQQPRPPRPAVYASPAPASSRAASPRADYYASSSPVPPLSSRRSLSGHLHPPPSGMVHTYGPSTSTSGPTTYGSSSPSPGDYGPVHHPLPPPPRQPPPPPQSSSSSRYPLIPSQQVEQLTHPLQQRPTRAPVLSNSEPTASVTRVADLLNSDETSDATSQKQSWESWFS